jgi:hypothetical protein
MHCTTAVTTQVVVVCTYLVQTRMHESLTGQPPRQRTCVNSQYNNIIIHTSEYELMPQQ